MESSSYQNRTHNNVLQNSHPFMFVCILLACLNRFFVIFQTIIQDTWAAFCFTNHTFSQLFFLLSKLQKVCSVFKSDVKLSGAVSFFFFKAMLYSAALFSERYTYTAKACYCINIIRLTAAINQWFKRPLLVTVISSPKQPRF